MSGWIKLHRTIQESPLWTAEKFTRGQAWIDLLMLANHSDSFFYKRDIKINVLRGHLARSTVELADRWKWSRTKVQKFLNDLENEQQIRQQKNNVTTLICIVNYDKYQQKEAAEHTAAKQQESSSKAAAKQQQDTYKNVKNDNNEKKGKNGVKFIKPSLDEIKTFISEKKYLVNADAFFNYYESNGWKVGKNAMKSWHSALATWNAKEKQPTGNNQPHYKVFGQ